MRESLLQIVVICVIATSPAYSTTQQSVDDAHPKPNISQSPDGYNVQFSAILEAYKAGNKSLGKELIEQFRLPQPGEWFTEHLGAERSKALTERYDRLFAAFAADMELGILDAIDNHLNLFTELKEGTEEMVLPKEVPQQKLTPLSGVTTIKKPALFYARFDRQRNGKSIGSWARAFTFEDGGFRFLGFGSKPFWIWENDSRFAGPPKKPLQLAKPIHQVPAIYPASARGVTGKVSLMLSIDALGKVTGAKVLSGDPALTKAAIDAAQQWRFEAPIRDGSPVESDYIAEFNFVR